MPLASTTPSGRARPRTGCPGRRRVPRVGVALLVEEARARPRGRRRRGASAGSSAWHRWQPGEVKTASESGVRWSKRSIRATRPPSSGPRGRSRERACGAIASRSSPSSRASARSATASAATPTSARASPAPSQASAEGRVEGRKGSAAKAAASSAARPTLAQPIRERPPRQPHGAPVRPRAISTTSASAKPASSAAAAKAAPGTFSATANASPASSAIVAAHAPARRRASRSP